MTRCTRVQDSLCTVFSVNIHVQSSVINCINSIVQLFERNNQISKVFTMASKLMDDQSVSIKNNPVLKKLDKTGEKVVFIGKNQYGV